MKGRNGSSGVATTPQAPGSLEHTEQGSDPKSSSGMASMFQRQLKRSRLTVKASSRPRIPPPALILCRGCRRYVFADTVTCPFCAGDVNALAAAYHDRLRAARKLSQRLRKRLKQINK